jgi:hypothetical protein
VREPCRGLAIVPGKSLAGASQSSPARTLLGNPLSGLHEDLHATSLHKDLHATTHVPLSLGLDVVDGVRAFNLKGGVLVSASQVVPARILPGASRAALARILPGLQLVFCSQVTGLVVVFVVLYLASNCPCQASPQVRLRLPVHK